MRGLAIDPRYRPALIALAGASAAYAIYLLRQRHLASTEAPNAQSQLRRRNAIRRHDAARHHPTFPSGVEEESRFCSEQAIAALRSRVEEHRSYGYIDIHSVDGVLGQDTGRRCEIEVPLLPGMLPTIEQFQAQEVGLSIEEAQALRRHAEKMFMDAFLVNQFPDFHDIGPLEVCYLEDHLNDMGIASAVIRGCIEGFNNDATYGAEIRRAVRAQDQPSPGLDVVSEFQRMGGSMEALDERETHTDEQSNFDWREGDVNTNTDRDGQNTLNLLYNIAADQARKDGYIHRGVECNGCGTMPIQGIRYRCANCLDFDLCESCEAQELHLKTHVFYKIRVPAPSLGTLGNSRQGLPVWYPGKPAAMPRSLPRELSNQLLQESGFENAELDALWDQFRCLAGTEWKNDPNNLGMAIDRRTFDKCFVPPLSIRPPPPNLIYDRMFAFYDTDNDGLIGFEEFLTGLAELNDKSRDGRLRRIFRGYDVDGDGYVDRRDFLRIFRAFYTLSKELNREMVAGMEEDLIESSARDIIHGTHPISSAFPGSIPTGQPSQAGVGKEMDSNGDLVINDNGDILDYEAHDVSARNRFIADVAMRRYSQSIGPPNRRPLGESNGASTTTSHVEHHSHPRGEDRSRLHEPSLPYHHHDWPPNADIEPEDISRALDGDLSLVEIMDPVDRSRVMFARSERLEREYQVEMDRRCNDAVRERWQRRKFYTDAEEGATAPPGYTEADSSDDDDLGIGDDMESITSASMSRQVSPRSRSSSKVRFEDSVTDTDHEAHSNTSTRSIPVGERWGGYEISEIEKDAGKEILYQTVQQGFNELLDQLFKTKEDLAMQAHKSRKLRRHHADEIRIFAEWAGSKSKKTHQKTERSNGEAAAAKSAADTENRREPVDSLLEEDGHLCNTATAHTTASYQDPTLPQFRPNEIGISNFLPPDVPYTLIAPESRSSLQPHRSSQSSMSFGSPPYNPSTIEIFKDLLQDEQTEREASVRGGFGKLDYHEFVRGMIGQLDDDDDDDSSDEDEEDADGDGDRDDDGNEAAGRGDGAEGVRSGLGHDQPSPSRRRNRRSGEEEEEGRGSNRARRRRRRPKEWAGGGGMGKLGFVGTWIEMASF